MIRIGLKPNSIKSHRKAYEDAKKDVSWRTFELVDNCDDKITIRLEHVRKNQWDFIRDTKTVMQELKAEREAFERGEIEELEIETLYAGEIAGILDGRFGYKVMPYPTFALVLGDQYGEIKDEELVSVIDDLEKAQKIEERVYK